MQRLRVAAMENQADARMLGRDVTLAEASMPAYPCKLRRIVAVLGIRARPALTLRTTLHIGLTKQRYRHPVTF